MRLVTIGGSDAAISAALRARELNAGADVQMIVADTYPNFSICGLPFCLSGEISDWRTLAHRTRTELESAGVVLHLDETAVAVDVAGKTVSTQPRDAAVRHYSYDRLIIATGAVPLVPRIEGIDLANVFVLHTMDDCFAMSRRLQAGVKSAVIIGGGYIGLEMADALKHRGVAVTLIEQMSTLMRTVDPSVGVRVAALMEHHGVTVKTQTTAVSIVEKTNELQVQCSSNPLGRRRSRSVSPARRCEERSAAAYRQAAPAKSGRSG